MTTTIRPPPGHRVLAGKEHGLHVMRCDPATCQARRAPPEGMSPAQAWERHLCDPRGCYLGCAPTQERLAAWAAANGYLLADIKAA